MDLTPESFAAWVDSFGRAWEARDAKAAADLYAQNGTYQVSPFVEPMRGHGPLPKMPSALFLISQLLYFAGFVCGPEEFPGKRFQKVFSPDPNEQRRAKE